MDKTKRFNPKILIVDDKPGNLSFFVDVLRPYGYDLNVATSGAKALESLNDFFPDLILLDVMMPEMDGYEVLQEIKKDQNTCDIPVIFLTAYNTTQDIIKGFEAGVVDYIAKPVHPKEMIARVNAHLEKAKLFSNLKKVMEHSFHELYTPLSVISSAMQMQELEYEKSQYTQMTLAACKTLQNIYEDIYYNLKYTSQKRTKKAFDLTKLLSERLEYFDLVAKSRSLEFKLDLSKNLEIVLNNQDMERVIDNLISNALKYTKEKEVITIKIDKKDDTWSFSICNPVTSHVDIDMIFKKYYRQEQQVFGLGIGLELVQSICNDNNIDIKATCEKNLFCISMKAKSEK